MCRQNFPTGVAGGSSTRADAVLFACKVHNSRGEVDRLMKADICLNCTDCTEYKATDFELSGIVFVLFLYCFCIVFVLFSSCLLSGPKTPCKRRHLSAFKDEAGYTGHRSTFSLQPWHHDSSTYLIGVTTRDQLWLATL
jgi:hypothetical protein